MNGNLSLCWHNISLYTTTKRGSIVGRKKIERKKLLSNGMFYFAFFSSDFDVSILVIFFPFSQYVNKKYFDHVSISGIHRKYLFWVPSILEKRKRKMVFRIGLNVSIWVNIKFQKWKHSRKLKLYFYCVS